LLPSLYDKNYWFGLLKEKCNGPGKSLDIRTKQLDIGLMSQHRRRSNWKRLATGDFAKRYTDNVVAMPCLPRLAHKEFGL